MSTCPACGEPLFGWLLMDSGERGGSSDSIVLERCERCRLGVAAEPGPRGSSASALLGSARQISDGRLELRVANRASIQASLGGRHWAALEPKRRLYPTPKSLPALAAAAGLEIEELGCPPPRSRPGLDVADDPQRVHLQRELRPPGPRAGTLRPGGAVGPPQVRDRRRRHGLLAALPVAIVSAPLELFAALAGRGGELVAVARRPAV